MHTIPKFEDVKNAYGGRPKKSEKKVRLSFYLYPEDSKKLRLLAQSRDVPVSELIRELVQKEVLGC